MTEELIERLHALEDKLYDARRERRWMEDWGKELYRKDDNAEVPDKFRLTITRNDFKVVFQREISREDVESEYLAALKELDERIERLEKEIADL